MKHVQNFIRYCIQNVETLKAHISHLTCKTVKIEYVPDFTRYCPVKIQGGEWSNAEHFRGFLKEISRLGSFRDICSEILVFLVYFDFTEEQIKIAGDEIDNFLSQIQFNKRKLETDKALTSVQESSPKKARTETPATSLSMSMQDVKECMKLFCTPEMIAAFEARLHTNQEAATPEPSSEDEADPEMTPPLYPGDHGNQEEQEDEPDWELDVASLISRAAMRGQEPQQDWDFQEAMRRSMEEA